MTLDNEKHMKNQPAFTSFPFTHGEAIMQLRGQIKEEMRGDMQQFFEDKRRKTQKDKYLVNQKMVDDDSVLQDYLENGEIEVQMPKAI